MINLDLNKLDQDKIRKQKRKKLLLISIAPCIILLVLGVFFLRPAITMMLYNMNYSGKNYKGAESVADTQNFLNIIEPYIADYQIGTAMIQDGSPLSITAPSGARPRRRERLQSAHQPGLQYREASR